MNCKYCGSEKFQKRGTRNGAARFQCSSCHRWFSGIVASPNQVENKVSTHVPLVPKILVFDIEMLPLEVMTFHLYEQNINPKQVLRDGCMLSWAAKWLGDIDIVSDVLTSQEAKNKQDERIVKTLWAMLDAADIVIYHNGDKFDLPYLRGRLLKYQIPNPSYLKSVDTCKLARSQFRLSANSLDYLLQFLGHDGKIATDITLWKRCLAGDLSALSEMDTYCRGDVWKLEEIYMAMLPYIPNHPNVNLWSGKDACPNCGCEISEPAGDYQGTTYLYDAYRCTSCKALWRSRKKKK